MEEKRPNDLNETIQFKANRGGGEPPPRQAYLTVIHGGGATLGRSVAVEDAITAGRDDSCDLVLLDPGVSRRHLRVRRGDEGVYFLEDLNSTNGTALGSRPVEGAVPLREGDKIFAGDTVLRFSIADEMDVGFQREIARMLATDPLTGLESKTSFDDHLQAALFDARRSGAGLALLMMDMDGIKGINDTHGHLFGAHCIRTAGRIIGEVIGRQGHACRFGGDEFTAYLPGRDRLFGLGLAERIRAAVDGAGMEKDGIPLHPTISIGVAAHPGDGLHVDDLVHAADLALYRAKARGKNCVSK
ncbi:MAG: GGDEF domain-containing protein [Candidatus Eisenbacteria bacterium]